jgi:arginyl-tRNA synthetase
MMFAQWKIQFQRFLYPIIGFSIAMLLLLPASFIGIAYYYNHDVMVNKPKLAEESLKIVSAYFLSIASLGISQLNEHAKFRRRATALKNVLKAKLKPEFEVIQTIVSSTLPSSVGDTFEELRLNHEFYQENKAKIDLLTMSINEAQQVLMKSDPEAIYLCQDYIGALEQVSTCINIYIKEPSRQGFEQFRQALSSLRILLSK